MHIDNRGTIAAMFVLTGLELPTSFNIDPGAFDRALEARKQKNAGLDPDALRFLATYDAARQLNSDMELRRAEAQAALGSSATPEKVNQFENIKARKLQQLRDEASKKADQAVIDAAEKAAQEEFEKEQSVSSPDPSAGGSGDESAGADATAGQTGADANPAGTGANQPVPSGSAASK